MTAPTSSPPFNVKLWREDFPILRQTVHGKPLVYLDNAATSQKPQVVIDTLRRYYEGQNANIHRGVYTLSQQATEAYETARRKAQHFLHAGESREIVFTRGTTEAINLVAQSYACNHLRAGDEIILTGMEHHSNIVPWQMVCQRTGAVLKVVPFTDEGELDLAAYRQLLSAKTKIVALVHLSNALGTINPIKQMTHEAHQLNPQIIVLADGAQWVPHRATDVQDLGVDFYAFSGHKIFGPTGIGVLYGRATLLEKMPPYQGGGDMIASVTFEKTTYNELPWKFEAGTPNISGAIGLGAALDYVEHIGLDNMAAWEHELLTYATGKLQQVPGLRIVGTAREKASVISMLIEGIHPHDVGTILDGEGIAVRTGHHCCQPIMDRLHIPATVRASLAFYNTREEIDALVAALHKVIEVFR